MVAKINRTLAVLYAVGLGIGEAIINWGQWQYAPLWIVDYMIVVWLLIGAFKRENAAAVLRGAWSFAFGVMYMALAFVTDPAQHEMMQAPAVLKALIGLLVALSFAGVVLSFWPQTGAAGRNADA
jgi:hypothetical protein